MRFFVYNKICMKTNYQPWNIDFEDFGKIKSDAEKLKFLIRFAVLAPSSHNSQPWIFEVKAGKILIKPDMSRALLESDKNSRQLFISLGCAIENIVVAGDYFGYSSRVEYSKDSARIIFSSSQNLIKGDSQHLAKYITERCTNRTPYTSRMPDAFLKELQKNTYDSLSVHIVSEQEKKDIIADAVLDAMEMAMDDDNFRLELSAYVKHNLTSSPVGMPGFGMGIPTALSFVAPFALRKMNVARKSRKQDEKLLKIHTPAYLVIATNEDSPIAWMETGRAYESLALLGTKHGVGIAPMAAVIQIGDFYKRVQNVLGSRARPQFFARIGYPEKEIAHSPRLSVSEVII
jgi:hypothetical protein